MLKVKLISLDTSVFGNLARDFFCRDLSKRRNARFTIENLKSRGYVPFFSHHHIEEILQHADKTVIKNRWNLIGEFPVVAWICSRKNKEILGSSLDIYEIEVKSYLERGERVNLQEFKKELREKYVRYVSGREFLSRFEELYRLLVESGALVDRSKEIESLAHVLDPEIQETKLSTLFSSQLIPYEKIEDTSLERILQLSKILEKNGDEKLTDYIKASIDFVSDVNGAAKKLYEGRGSLFENFVQCQGVRLEQVGPRTTVAQLGRLATFNERVRLFLKNLDLPVELESKFSFTSLVTWSLWEHFELAMRKEARAHGSNMADREINIFNLFLDVIVVDKRVKEYFRQLYKANSELEDELGRVVKLRHYKQLNEL